MGPDGEEIEVMQSLKDLALTSHLNFKLRRQFQVLLKWPGGDSELSGGEVLVL